MITRAGFRPQFTTQRNNVNKGQNQRLSFGVRVSTTDVIQVVTGCILKSGGINGIYKTCEAMTGRPVRGLFELTEVMRQCREVLIKKFPVLNVIKENASKEKTSFKDKKKYFRIQRKWLKEQREIFGSNRANIPKFEVDEEKIQQAAAKLKAKAGLPD